jgi:LmbE family N-acetylglucosaminyl deacetylase
MIGAVPVPGELVVFSPHLDDAVLSLGALIAARVRAGEPVEVWTAFTRAPSPGTVSRGLRRFADYDARIAEDDRALDLLGAGRRRLDLPERVWRTPPARGLRAAFRTPADRAGFQQLERLDELAGEALARPGVLVLAPLGVGHHVDHVEVAVAVLTAALRLDATDRVGFYEDFYALGNAARRRHPVTRQDGGPAWRRVVEAPGWAGPLEGLVLRATPLIGAGPSLGAYLPGRPELVWHRQQHPVDAWSQNRQLAAVAEYRSQTPALGGMRRLGPIIRRAHRVRGGDLIWSARRR